ncbi:BTB/POZ domain-containing protein 1-like [Neocloeon triangulifer]|uniref:BTB/POZ domain-containing protein 1-like n=1 Tax=Neocloeon triangulifer TaxID=2078957 RepID=UPI00286EFFF6|nr:BTB/POZ domain-containing protein 1-like [Neocloeon triangulifer]XP_059468358.1 BTB/POZ domain-containing protein 1-like [Neocloeon triangulifer]
MENSGNNLKTEEWQRTGDLCTDYLHLYLSSIMYDVTFRVGDARSKNSYQKIFHCHKLILSAASKVFQAMFYGYFQEANKGPDDEILIDDSEPEVFDAAMRFIYGRQIEVFTIEDIAAKVYKFGNKWQIGSLVKASERFLVEPSPENVALIYDIFKMVGNEVGAKRCLKVIVMNTNAVLNSPHWCNISEEQLMDILSQNELDISCECDLLEALIQWGLAKVNAEGNCEISHDQVRSVINKPLQKIRFLSMGHQDFAKFCMKNKNNIFSSSEKLDIMTSLSLKSPESLPKDFSKEDQSRSIFDKAIIFDLKTRYNDKSIVYPNVFKFSIDKDARLLGFKFLSFEDMPINFKPNALYTLFELLDGYKCNENFDESKCSKICEGNTVDDYDEIEEVCRFRKSPVIANYKKYAIRVKYFNVDCTSLSEHKYKKYDILKGDILFLVLSKSCSAGIGALLFLEMPRPEN